MISELVLFLFTVIVIAYFLWTRNYKYWEDRGVPCLPAGFPLGSLKGVDPFKHNLCDFLQYLYNLHENEPVIGFYGPTEPFLLIKDLDMVKSVLVSDFESFHTNGFITYGSIDPMIRYNTFGTQNKNEWKTIRGIHSPLFTQTRVKNNVPQMIKISKSMVEFIHKHSDNNLKANPIWWKFAADNVLSIGFGVDNDLFNGNHKVPLPSQDVLFGSEWSCNAAAYCSLFLPWLAFILRCRSVGKSAGTIVGEWGNTLIEERKLENKPRVDIIQRMIEKIEKDKQQNNSEMPQYVKAAQIMTLMNDGIETVSNALTTALYDIARHNDVQEKLRQEILTVGDNIDDFDGEKILSLKYLDDCITESLRLRTPIPVMTRQCTKDTTLGKLTVAKGTKVFIPILAIQTDSKHFQEPQSYNPDRYSGGDPSTQPPLYSFGGGPRSCLGMRYAKIVQKVAIIAVLLKFKIYPVNDDDQLETSPTRHEFFFCLPKLGHLKFEPL